MFDETVGIHSSAAEEFVTMREKVVRPTTAAPRHCPTSKTTGPARHARSLARS
jgi:hypothetical protein